MPTSSPPSTGLDQTMANDDLRARRMKSGRTIMALILREMSTTYGRSPGGYLWALIEPAAAIAVLSIGFSLLFRSPTLGTNFALFFASGYLPFAIYQIVERNTAIAMRFSRALLAYPAVTYADAILARFLLAAVTQIMVMAIVLVGIHVIFDLYSIIDYPALLLTVVLAAGLGLGVGVLNCYLTAVYPVWGNIWGIVTRPLFLISGVLFTFDSMPTAVQNVLWYNPIIQIVGISRTGIYATYRADYVSVAYVLGVMMIVGGFGFLLLYRHNRTVLNA